MAAMLSLIKVLKYMWLGFNSQYVKIVFSSHNNSTGEEIRMSDTFISVSKYDFLVFNIHWGKKRLSHYKDIIFKQMDHSCPNLVVNILKFLFSKNLIKKKLSLFLLY